MLISANSKINFWQIKLLAEKTLTDEEKSNQDAWLDYLDKRKVLECTRVTDDAGYGTIEWPDKSE